MPGDLFPEQVAQFAGAGQRGGVLHLGAYGQRVTVPLLAYHRLEVEGEVRHLAQRLLYIVDEQVRPAYVDAVVAAAEYLEQRLLAAAGAGLLYPAAQVPHAVA